jgi:hypothetical protein
VLCRTHACPVPWAGGVYPLQEILEVWRRRRRNRKCRSKGPPLRHHSLTRSGLRGGGGKASPLAEAALDAESKIEQWQLTTGQPFHYPSKHGDRSCRSYMSSCLCIASKGIPKRGQLDGGYITVSVSCAWLKTIANIPPTLGRNG